MSVQTFLDDKSRTWELFDAKVSKHYDRISDVISLGLFRRWRKALTQQLPAGESLDILDLATGTGAIPFSLLEGAASRINSIVGVDLSEEMMDVFRASAEGHPHAAKLDIQYGDATKLSLDDSSFDAVTMSCGLRNVSDHHACCEEILRVLKPGGRAIFLEPAVPNTPLLKAVYRTYFRHIVPTIAGLVSNPTAYRYFCDSVEAFMQGPDFLAFLNEKGFVNGRDISLTLGAVRLYIGEKPVNNG